MCEQEEEDEGEAMRRRRGGGGGEQEARAWRSVRGVRWGVEGRKGLMHGAACVVDDR